MKLYKAHEVQLLGELIVQTLKLAQALPESETAELHVELLPQHGESPRLVMAIHEEHHTRSRLVFEISRGEREAERNELKVFFEVRNNQISEDFLEMLYLTQVERIEDVAAELIEIARHYFATGTVAFHSGALLACICARLTVRMPGKPT